MRTYKDITDLANSLSHNDFVALANHFARNCEVFFGALDNKLFTSDVAFFCLNGSIIQINTALSECESILHDEFISAAIEQHNKGVKS